MATATAHHAHEHQVPLWGLFLALVALTIAEVGLYEVWLYGAKQGNPFIPKYALVLIILLVLTLPKAAIVMIYFMHLKFEKQLVVFLSLVPFVFAAICILLTLADIRANMPWGIARPSAIYGHDLYENAEPEAVIDEEPASDVGY